MKKISFALVGAASLALAACGGQGDDALAENVQENYENAAENVDAMAENATGAEAATLGNQADALEAEGVHLVVDPSAPGWTVSLAAAAERLRDPRLRRRLRTRSMRVCDGRGAQRVAAVLLSGLV